MLVRWLVAVAGKRRGGGPRYCTFPLYTQRLSSLLTTLPIGAIAVSLVGPRLERRETSQELECQAGVLISLPVLRTSGRLVVERAGLQAAVHDPDEPVGDLAQRGAVAEAALEIVVGAGAGGDRQGGEGLAVEGIRPRSAPSPTSPGRSRCGSAPPAPRRPRPAARRFIACSRAIPAAPSGSRALASTRPDESISSTS